MAFHSSSLYRNMAGWFTTPRILSPPISPIPKSLSTHLPLAQYNLSISPKSPNQIPRTTRTPSRFTTLAEESNNGVTSDNQNGSKQSPDPQQTPLNFNFSWKDLLNPDPENIFAIGLTGVLTWASVQVLWQLFIIAIAIVLAALKYSFIAALLLFILITLL